jgi:hypothetical protein
MIFAIFLSDFHLPRIFHGMFNPFLPFLHPTKKDLDIPWHMSSLVNWNLVDELGCTIIWDNATWPQMIDGMLYYRVSNLPHDNTLQILNVKHSQSTQRQSWHRKFRNQQISDWTSACWTVWNRKSFHGFPFKAIPITVTMCIFLFCSAIAVIPSLNQVGKIEIGWRFPHINV